jgi:hypothetical protein
MGIYSSFKEEDLWIVDLKGLTHFMEVWKKCFPDSWINKIEMIRSDESGTRITFERWDNIKLISYWYDEQVLFLEMVAPYIEGQVYWDSENDDEAGWVEFSNKDCTIHTGQMNWGSWKPMSAYKENVPIPIDLLKLHLANKVGET